MPLGELLYVVNDGQLIEIVDSDTGEILFPETECSEFMETITEPDDTILEVLVEDINCYNNVLTICVLYEED